MGCCKYALIDEMSVLCVSRGTTLPYPLFSLKYTKGLEQPINIRRKQIIGIEIYFMVLIFQNIFKFVNNDSI